MQQSHEPDAHAKLVELTKHLLAGHDGPRKLVTQSYRDVTQQYLALPRCARASANRRPTTSWNGCARPSPISSRTTARASVPA